ncbi:MAG: prephenate dehydrogenase [Lachnospiraceae bacterium]|nr:prephenate dehydrogenase [Lachnospiraceae bacterium]
MSTYGFICLGLIGGSVARAIREKQPGSTIIAYNRSASSLDEALSDGVIDIAVYEEDMENGGISKFSSCDYIFLCAPVKKNEEFLELLKPVISPSCIITDVGSVKTGIHEAAERLDMEANFIGGHPMAGSERVGYTNSKASILQNAYYILTPTKKSPAEKVAELRSLVQSFDSIPLVLSFKEHDYIVAAISHLPHVIAASLVNLVKDSDNEEGIMRLVAAGGFKDITRIASSSSDMWEQICMTNTENIKNLLEDYIDSLKSVDVFLKEHNGDKIRGLFDTAREYRDSFTTAGSGPIKVNYRLFVDIADEPGALATIATLLATRGISIKNIGIIHNSEYQGGNMRIEFYYEPDLESAAKILEDKRYTIHK